MRGLWIPALAGSLWGCQGSGDSVEASLFGGPSQAGAGTGTRSRARPPLSAEEGRKLVADLQKHPNRVKKLTPRERQFLAQALESHEERRQDKNGD